MPRGTLLGTQIWEVIRGCDVVDMYQTSLQRVISRWTHRRSLSSTRGGPNRLRSATRLVPDTTRGLRTSWLIKKILPSESMCYLSDTSHRLNTCFGIFISRRFSCLMHQRPFAASPSYPAVSCKSTMQSSDEVYAITLAYTGRGRVI